jgi:tetratricopeptide (TPR) repeat protein
MGRAILTGLLAAWISLTMNRAVFCADQSAAEKLVETKAAALVAAIRSGEPHVKEMADLKGEFSQGKITSPNAVKAIIKAYRRIDNSAEALKWYSYYAANWPQATDAGEAYKWIAIYSFRADDPNGGFGAIKAILSGSTSKSAQARIISDIIGDCLGQVQKAESEQILAMSQQALQQEKDWNLARMKIVTAYGSDHEAEAIVKEMTKKGLADEKMVARARLFRAVRIKLEAIVNGKATGREVVSSLAKDYGSDPALPDALLWIATELPRRGDVANISRLGAEGAAICEDVIARYSTKQKLPKAYESAVSCYVVAGDDLHAKEQSDKLSAGNPESLHARNVLPSAYYTAGLHYLNLGAFEKAAKAFENASSGKPRYEFADYCLFAQGFCYEQMQNAHAVTDAQARPVISAVYSKLLATYPESQYAAHAADWLQASH